jgi:predicted CXXCH cytochrome family protein
MTEHRLLPFHGRMLAAASALLVAPTLTGQVQSVIISPHNLSAGSPGQIRATSEQEVCIFCHTPHNATAIRPLWNRELPTSSYTVYASRSLDAQPGQPTGSSKLCLSCHDGTIALGAVASRSTVIQMAAGVTVLPPGASNLGTDLSDDHPISFVYNSALTQKDRALAHPNSLPKTLRLDSNGELQCTTCHDAHNNVYGDFLTMSNLHSEMCTSCHSISKTTISAHTDCATCHKTHTAPSGPYLLGHERITTTCTGCHDGSRPGAQNIAADLSKLSVHDTESEVDPPEPFHAHSTCADCHDPHSMRTGVAVAPAIQPTLGDVSGVNSSGAKVAIAQNEFEVCFKCHSDQSSITEPTVARQILQMNTRLEFALNAVSSHPVIGAGKNPDVPSLRSPWTTASVLYCSDCHNSDTGSKAGGSGPNGVHGSANEPLLIARYETDDFTAENAGSYALCYRCHNRSGGDGILSDASFRLHKKHIVDERTPCSACHDAHGIASVQGTARNNSNLINFDISIVQPFNGTRRFEDQGLFRGSCTLTCHGFAHNNSSY